MLITIIIDLQICWVCLGIRMVEGVIMGLGFVIKVLIILLG